MAVRPVLRMGDARLLRRAEPAGDFGSAALRALLVDMRDTMQALNGAGLAAPQIGVNLRVVIFGVEKTSRYPDAEAVPETVLINPVIAQLDDEIEEAWEGCLSLPGARGASNNFLRGLIAALLGTRNPHVLFVHSGFCVPCALHSSRSLRFFEAP